MNHTMIAAGRFSYATGAADSITVPAGAVVTGLVCYSLAGGTLTITPKGANQTSTAGAAIPIPATVPWFPLSDVALSMIGAGTILAFAGTTSYCVTYATLGQGA